MIRAAMALAAGTVLLAGCGLKGPLYLPEHNAAVITRPAAPQAAPASAPATPPAAPAAPQKHDDDASPPQ